MTTLNAFQNGFADNGFRGLFKPRDIFLHDGAGLRRVTLGSPVQIGAAVLAVALLLWSAFATFQAFTAVDRDAARLEQQVAQMEADVVAIRREAARRAAVLEQRQLFLAQMMSGEANAAELARLLPQHAEQPNGAAADVARQFAGVDGQQQQMVDLASAANKAWVREASATLRRLGLNPSRFHHHGVGGPLEEATQHNADPRFRDLFASWQQAERLEQGVTAIPSAKPVSDANFTSGFGVRSDPFRTRAAFHAGVDLAGPVGTPIYATADGIVGRSEYSGAYGNLVEINHGEGIQTRYAHLSRGIARAGQRVRRGDLIGLMGSTGRSTGSHLHYEVRIDGRAVNPMPFIQSNETLMALQRRAGSTAMGGPASGAR